jgi:hypothetical protein
MKHDDDDSGSAPAASKAIAKPVTVPRQLTKSDEDATAAIDTGVSLKELKRQRKIQRIEKRLTEEAAFALAAMPAQQFELTKGEAVTSPDMSALETAIAKLSGQITARDELLMKQQKVLKKQQKVIDELAAQPDPTVSAYRGGMLTAPAFMQKSADTMPAAPDMADIQNRTRAMMLGELEAQFRTSADPAQREAAWKSILTMRGVGG